MEKLGDMGIPELDMTGDDVVWKMRSIYRSVEWLDAGKPKYAPSGKTYRDLYKFIVFLDEEAITLKGSSYSPESDRLEVTYAYGVKECGLPEGLNRVTLEHFSEEPPLCASEIYRECISEYIEGKKRSVKGASRKITRLEEYREDLKKRQREAEERMRALGYGKKKDKEQEKVR